MTDPRLQLPDALVEAIAERAAEIVLDRLARQPPKRWLTRAEAAEYARCDVQRISDLRSQGRLSMTGDGRAVRVDRLELDRHLAKGAEGG